MKLPSRKALCTVQDAIHFNHFLANSIDGKPRQPCQHQFASIRLPSGTAPSRKRYQHSNHRGFSEQSGEPHPPHRGPGCSRRYRSSPGQRAPSTGDAFLPGVPCINQRAHVFVLHKLALVGRNKAPLDFTDEPIVVAYKSLDRLGNKRFPVPPLFCGDPIQLAFHLNGQSYFHDFILSPLAPLHVARLHVDIRPGASSSPPRISQRTRWNTLRRQPNE